VDMSAEGGLAGAKPLAESVGTHGAPFWLV
jgi:hypothetical protein